MTSPRELCDRRRLDLFLQDRLPEDSKRDLEDHLDFCPACRDKLDQLAGGDNLWTEVRHYLGGDGASELPARNESAARRLANINLSFLKPSDKNSSLGRLGPYEVLEVVGRGGWGVVLKGFDSALHRPIAIKVLAPEYAANRKARDRFEREARAVAGVSHDHVVPIHAVEPDATPPYLVMAFIAGQSLQQRIDRTGPLHLREVLRIGMQTASGLAAAHAQGLVHRDIKPANIMLENGVERVRITDFGLARAVHDASVTQSGAVTGTPQYMAPEQAEAGLVDQRADLFALGSVLYAMATGQPPFPGESALAIMRQVCDKEPVPLRYRNPAMPDWLEGIIQKLHKKDAQNRFQTAAEVAELLEGCLAHVQQPYRHPLPALAAKLGRQVPNPSRPRKSIPRWPAAVVVTALVGGAVLLSLPRSMRNPDNAAPLGVPAALAATPSSEFDGNEFQEHRSQLQSQIDVFAKTWNQNQAGEIADLETGFTILGQRAEILRRDLVAVPKMGPDPIDIELHNIRKHLEKLQKQSDSFHK